MPAHYQFRSRRFARPRTKTAPALAFFVALIALAGCRDGIPLASLYPAPRDMAQPRDLAVTRDFSPAADLAMPLAGSIGPAGGSVSRLYFAVVGDTRPANPDDTANYPTAVINRIYADIEAASPHPEFVLTTGDYMFANTWNTESTKQMDLYLAAARQFTGPVFPTMGNHECTGATAGNCIGAPTANLDAFTEGLLTPLGLTVPYYTIPVTDLAGRWTAKLIVVACNAWDATQKAWLDGELAKDTTYTIVVRHEPSYTTNAPCVTPMDQTLAAARYDLLIAGHSHTFNHTGNHEGREVVIGNGGAPLTGNVDFGYAIVDQQADGSFQLTRYDYLTALPLESFTVP